MKSRNIINVGVMIVLFVLIIRGNVFAEAGQPTRYLSGRILSPITPTVALRLKTLFQKGAQNGLKANVFFKVGDSITASYQFLDQFKYPAFDPKTMSETDNTYTYNLGNYQYLETAHAYFLSGRIGSTTPYERNSLAARSGTDAKWALSGTPSPLEAELQASKGAYGIIMFGTNDFRMQYPDAYIYQLIVGTTFQMLDYCIANGSIPILTSPPPHPTLGSRYWLRSRMTSRLLRATAQGRQVPFIDYYASLLDLPLYGLINGTDIHPNAMADNRRAWLTAEGLKYGQNMRHLLSLQSLDRMYQLLVQGGAAPDTETAGLQGSGLASNPYVIDGLDFSDYQQPAAGSTEVVYKLTVSGNGDTWQFAAAGHEGDVFSLELRDGQGTVKASSATGTLDSDLTAGTYTIRVKFPASVKEFVFVSLATNLNTTTTPPAAPGGLSVQ